MDGCKVHERLIPAASPPSTREAFGRPRKVGIVAVLSSVFIVCAAAAPAARSVDLRDKEYMISCSDVIHTACNKTLYVDLCISSLSSYPGACQANLSEISRIAVNVSLREAQQVSQCIADLAQKAVDESEMGALQDCLELFQYSVQELNDSLSALTSGQHEGDVQTWLSAALTYPDTCVEGLKEVGADSISVVRPKSEKVEELISNALAIYCYSHPLLKMCQTKTMMTASISEIAVF